MKDYQHCKSLCTTCNGREDQNSLGGISCAECEAVADLIDKAIQHRHHTAKICPNSKTQVNTLRHRKNNIKKKNLEESRGSLHVMHRHQYITTTI